jgi:hypothetical protein
MTPAIEQAIAEIRATFDGHPIDVDPDPEGGAFVKVHDLSLGDQYEPSVSWVAFRITFQYPHADVYPHFCVGGLKRKDGTELVAPFHKATWETPRGAEASISVSRRANHWNAAVDTAAIKLTRVLEWIRSQ